MELHPNYQPKQRQLAYLKTTTMTQQRKLKNLQNQESESEPVVSTKSTQNQFRKVKNKTTDTVEKDHIPLRKYGDNEPGISTKSTQSQSSKIKKNRTTDTVKEDHIPLRKDVYGTRDLNKVSAKPIEQSSEKQNY